MSAEAELWWLPFYVERWRGDEDVAAMSLAARGLYIECLFHEWVELSIPDDPVRLALVIRADPQEVQALWSVVRAKFAPFGAGRLINRKLERVRREQRGKQRRLSAAGARGATVRWERERERQQQELFEAGAAADAVPMRPDSDPDASRVEKSRVEKNKGGSAPAAPPSRKAGGNPDVAACVGAFRRHVQAWPCRAKDAPHLVRLCKAQGQARVLEWIERLWGDVQTDAFLAKLGYGVPALLNKATAYATADAGAVTPVAFGALSPAGQALLDRSLGNGPAVPAIGRTR